MIKLLGQGPEAGDAVRDGLLELHRDGPLATVRLNRPEALNALSPQLSRELLDCITAVSADQSVRAVLLTGAGRAFCAGADLKTRAGSGASPLHVSGARLDEIFHPIILEIRSAPKPFVAAVQGAAVGLGVALALACDLIVADTTAYFLLPYVRLGLGLDGGVSAFLAARIGIARAAELCMIGERLPARQAADWGIINGTCEPDELAGEAHRLASRLAAGPTVALASIKEALSAAAHPHLAQQLQLESALQSRCVASPDYQEGRAAFDERRSPDFRAVVEAP